ncbi:hypothetical protein OXIME_000252 [Oxyplasma meridianum]|uniref:Uncharacterized protein n=1 Tax=Oxyplasma meridianum TaxID=3073602 RepID=A0AAX4NEB7_9ARCH
MSNPYDFWEQVIFEVLDKNRLTVPKSPYGYVPGPEKSGLFVRSIGEPKGQIADWRASVPGSVRGVHAVEYRDRYEVHVDRFDPAKKPISHLLLESPGSAILLGTLGLLAAFLGGSFFKK